MELDEASLDGHWATNSSSGVEFFIINDATFSKLCILGSDVEPCFEGASVTDKQVSKDFTYNLDFIPTLSAMMSELKDALQYSKGESNMEKISKEEVEEITTKFAEAPIDEAAPITQFDDSDTSDEPDEDTESDNDLPASNDEVGAEEPILTSAEDKEEDDKDDDDDETDSDDDPDERKRQTKHSLEEIQAEFVAVQAELETTKSLLEAANDELNVLREFKLGIENQQKDALIAKYHMLSDEAREEISSHKSEYSLEEIESKLALAFVKENVDFEQVDGKAAEAVEEETPAIVFSLDTAVDTSIVSPVLQALRDAKNN